MVNKILLSVMLSVIACATTFAQTDKIIDAMSAVKKKVTKNGITISVIENKLNNATFCRLFFEPAPQLLTNKYPLVTLTGKLLCEGNDTLAPILYKNWVNDNGILVGSGYNFFTIMSSDSNFDTIFTSMIMPLNHPRFDQGMLQKFKKNEIKKLTNFIEPAATAKQAINTVYKIGNPNSNAINADSINAIERQDCANFYTNVLKNCPKHLVIITNINADSVFAKAEKYFTDISVTEHQKKYKQKNKPLSDNVIYFEHQDNKKYTNLCEFSTITYKNENLNFGKDATMKLSNEVFGNPKNGYFLTELEAEYKYAKNCASSINYAFQSAYWVTQATCQPENLAQAVLSTYDIKKAFLNMPLSNQLVENAAETLNNNFLQNLLSLNETAKMIHFIQKNKLPANFYKNYSLQLKTQKPENIRDYMARNFKKSNTLTLIKGNIDIWFNQLLKLTQSADIYILKNDSIVEFIAKGFGPKRLATTFLAKNKAQERPKKGQIIKAQGTYTSEGNTYPVTLTTYRKKNKFRSELWLYLDSSSYLLKNRTVEIVSNGTKFKKIIIDTVKRILIEKKIYNGKKATLENQHGGKLLEGKDLQDIIALSKPFDVQNYFADSTETEIIGRFTEDTVTFYTVKVKMPSGKEQFDYFDSKTGLKIKTEFLNTSDGKQIDKVILFSDYKEVPKTDGQRIAYTKNIITDRREMILQVTKTNFKAKIPNSKFKVVEKAIDTKH